MIRLCHEHNILKVLKQQCFYYSIKSSAETQFDAMSAMHRTQRFWPKNIASQHRTHDFENIATSHRKMSCHRTHVFHMQLTLVRKFFNEKFFPTTTILSKVIAYGAILLQFVAYCSIAAQILACGTFFFNFKFLKKKFDKFFINILTSHPNF